MMPDQNYKKRDGPDPAPPRKPRKRKRRPRKLPVFLTAEEAERLLAAARSARDRALFGVMLYAGLRVAEACALRVERIDLARGELLVYQGKNSKDRLLPIAAKLAPLLREHL